MIETFHKWINNFGVPYNIDEFGTITWDNLENKTVPTKAEIDAKRIELTTEYDAQEYARNRAVEYPSLGDQMDMIYKDNKNSTTTHADAVEAVKTKWPKDNSGPK